MHPHDMKYIGFKHQRENKQNSDNNVYIYFFSLATPKINFLFVYPIFNASLIACKVPKLLKYFIQSLM